MGNILGIFCKHGKVREGDSLPADIIGKEIGMGLGDVYRIAVSLEQEGLIEIKNLKKGEIGSAPDRILGFWIELTKEGESSIKSSL